MPTVLIVSNHALQRRGLRMLLETRPDLTVLGDAATGSDAVRLCEQGPVDVVLLDSRLPGADDLDTIRRLTRSESVRHTPRVLVLSLAGFDEYGYAALRAGAGGFLTEEATPDELAAAVHTVAAGDAVLPPALTQALIDAVRREAPAPAREPEHRLGTLTGRERDVLAGVASGWSNAEIAERLSIAPTTVKSHVSSILTKIDAHARVQAVVFAYESGLVRPS
ncbi:LuxR C-terminal-related transcriptional regulator [Streptomyces sp. 7R007]